MTSPLARATVEIHADTKGFDKELRRAVDRDLKDVEKNATKTFSRIGKAISTLGQATGIIGSFASLTAVISTMLPAVLALAGALSALSGALIVIPGLLAAVGAAGFVLRLGLKGVGDAMSAIASGDAEALSESLKKLAPNARAFVKEIAKVAPQFKALQQSIQNILFDDLAAQIQPIVKNIFPGFSSGLKDISEALSAIPQQIGAFLQSVRASETITNFLPNVADSIAALAPGFRAATEALFDLVGVGGQFLPQLADSLSGALQRFGARIREAADSGELAGRLQAAISLLGQLGRIAGNVAGAIGNIFFAASSEGQGDNLLDRIERLTAAFRQFTAEADGAKIAQFLNVLATIAPIAIGVALLANSITFLAGAIAFLATPVGAVVGVLALLGAAFILAYKYVTPFRDAVNSLVAVIGPTVVATFQQVSSFIQTQLVPAFQGAMNALRPLINSLGPVLRDTVLPVIRSIISAYQQQFVPILQTVRDVINNTVTPAIQRLTAAYLANKPQIDAVISAVGTAIGFMGRLAAIVAGGVIKVLINLAGFVLGQVINGITRLINVIGFVVRAFGAAGSAVSAFANSVRNGINTAISFVASLPGRIRSAIGNLGSILYNAGVSLVEGLGRGIRDAAGRAIAAARSLVDRVRNFFPFSPAKEGPFSGRGWVLYSGEAISQAFAQGIKQSTALATQAASQLAAATSAPLGGGIGTARSVGGIQTAQAVTGTTSMSTVTNSPTINIVAATGNPQAIAMSVLNRLAAAVI